MFFFIGELAALGAALCWAFSGVISTEPIRKIGAFAFNRLRMILVLFMLIIISWFNSNWEIYSIEILNTLLISGLVGIFIGDTALFNSIKILGPSRSAVIFSLNAPLTILMSWFFLNEKLKILTLFGCISVLVGVLIAILGRKTDYSFNLDAIQGKLLFGVFFGIIAAFGQALGSIIAKPAMVSGIDPFMASGIRVSITTVAYIFFSLFYKESKKNLSNYSLKLLFHILISGFLAMVLGMTLLLFSLTSSKTGIAATLSSTTPIIILPILWIKTKKAPPLIAWVGAFISIVGIFIISISQNLN